MRYLVTGATGYIGGRLAPRLLGHGPEPGLAPDPAAGPVHVRCLVRDPGKLADVPWGSDAEIVRGDLLDPADMRAACADVDVVYVLGRARSGADPAATERRAALVLAEAAREAGVQRIVYLDGPPPSGVGETLLRSGVPTAVLRATVILGSGSASFEMLRHLTERLPVAVAPRWVRHRVRPIAVRDVLHHLIRVAEIPDAPNRTFDIGGPEVRTYLDMMRGYAAVAGLRRRRVLPVPVSSPVLSANWVNMVTPVPRTVARPLIEALVHDAVRTGDDDIAASVPEPPGGLLGYERTVALALARSTGGGVETRWSDATVDDVPSDPLPDEPGRAGGRVYLDERERATGASPERLWTVVEGIGGERGWYSFALAWTVRGWMDRLVGGVGLSRGRRDPDDLRTGDALDWWRVERLLEPGGARPPGSALGPREGMVRLRAEMRVPGRAWLEMAVVPHDGGAVYHQRAVFVPHGVPGHLYWWSVAPFHGIVFGGMVRNITRTAERADG